MATLDELRILTHTQVYLTKPVEIKIESNDDKPVRIVGFDVNKKQNVFSDTTNLRKRTFSSSYNDNEFKK